MPVDPMMETASPGFDPSGRRAKASGRGREDVSGAQCIHRSLQVMRLLAGSPPQGLKLVDIAAELELSHPTAYRILKALEHEGVVERAQGSRRYTIGSEMVWLGLGAARRFPIALAAAPALDRAMEELGDTILLSVRSGDYSVCVERRNGGYPVRVTSAVVGSRLPLGVSPAGRTMLAFLPERTSVSIMAANESRLKTHDCSPESVAEEVEYAKSRGYLYCDGITVRNTRALTVPVFDPGGVPVAAISTIATRSRLPDSRLPAVIRSMTTCARTISDQLLRSATEQARNPNFRTAL